MMNEWIPLANFVLNTLFIPLLVILVQIKTSIAASDTKIANNRSLIDDHVKRMDQIDRHCEATDDRFLQHVIAQEKRER